VKILIYLILTNADMINQNPNVSTKKVSHSTNVDIDNVKGVFSKKEKHRYLLTIPFSPEETRTKILSIILKNPSSATEDTADTTVNRVENYVYKNFSDVGTINVLNLYSYRATDAADLQKFIDDRPVINEIAQNRNDQVIKSTLEESDYIMVAWGGNTQVKKGGYETRVDEIIELLNQDDTREKVYEVIRNKGNRDFLNNTPFHAQNWGYKDSCVKYFIRV